MLASSAVAIDVGRLVLELLNVRVLEAAQDLVDRFLGAAIELLEPLANASRATPSSMRTSRPVANASIFSASMSNGLAVATSR